MTASAEGTSQSRWLGAAAIAALILCLVVQIIRVRATWIAQHTAPGLAVTSGCEEAGWFTIWKAAQGLPVFADTASPPYAAAYFNWMFYHLTSALLPASPSGAAIIQTSRAIALASAVLGAIVFGVWAWQLYHRRSLGWQVWAAVMGALAFLGPLIGWWSLTARPDITALLAEAAAILVVITFRHRAPIVTTVAAALLFYAAWSFKPNFVCGIASFGAFLLIRRAWGEAARFTAITLGLWGVTLLVGGCPYVEGLKDTLSSNEFYLALGLDNARYATTGCLHLVALIPALWRLRPIGKASEPPGRKTEDALVLGLIGLVITLVGAFIMSSKVGASRNYYFSSAMFATIALLAAMLRRPQPRLAMAAAVAACAVPIALLGGWRGALSLQPHALELQQRWHLWNTLPEPRFSDDPRLNVPWLNPSSPPFILAFNYAAQRRAGRTFVGDGVGGHITRGELAALLLPQNTADHYDGASLAAYERGRTVVGMTAFVRKNAR